MSQSRTLMGWTPFFLCKSLSLQRSSIRMNGVRLGYPLRTLQSYWSDPSKGDGSPTSGWEWCMSGAAVRRVASTEQEFVREGDSRIWISRIPFNFPEKQEEMEETKSLKHQHQKCCVGQTSIRECWAQRACEHLRSLSGEQTNLLVRF